MFKNDFQGGPCFEIFSPQQKESTNCWKVTGAVRKNYEKDVKSYAYILEGATATTKMCLPKDSRTTLHLVQRYLVVQLALKKGADFSMEIGVADMKNNKRRIFLSTAQKDIHITPLHAKVALKIVKTGVWLNLVLDMVAMVGETWRGETFKLLESICISANCRVRRIFTMKSQPPETVEDNELYGYSPSVGGEMDMIPKQCQFAADVEHYTQLLTIDKIRHAERLRGGGTGGDVRGSVNSAFELDLNASGRKSTANESFHIAFGSKVPGVRTSQSAGKKSSREGNLTNRSIRSHSRADDGTATVGYLDMSSSVNSRDGLYTGQDPGGGVRDAGAGEIPQHIPIPPPDKAPQKSVRKGHQRQYSDPSAVSQIESGTVNIPDIPLVQPHPPREPSHERVRRRPRVKNGSAGKSRISSTGTQNGVYDEGMRTSLSSAVSNHQGNADGRLDMEPLNTSTSSNDSGPRGKSAETARKPPVDTRTSKTQRKEYQPSNYQLDGPDIDESMTNVIELLNQQKLDFRFNDSLEDERDAADTDDSYEDAKKGDDTYLFVSQPKPAPKQKNASPLQYLMDNEINKQEVIPQKVKGARDLKSRGPRPEEDFINDSSSDNDDDKQRVVVSRPSSGSRPNSGTRPGSGARPNSGTHPNSGSRPGSGTRSGKPGSAGRSHARTLLNPPNNNTTPPTVTGPSDIVHNGAIPIEIKVPSLYIGNMEENDINVPPLAGSPSFTSGITDRSCISRMSRKSLREVPISKFSNSINDEKQVYDFSKYVMEDLSASAEAKMLEEIQGARSEEFEPDNRISPRKEELHLPRKSPRKSFQSQRYGGDGMLKGLQDESPSTSEDDTSFSTWKAPPQPPKEMNHQKEMKARLSSDTLTSSNQGDWSGKCSPPVLIVRSGLASNSLDDISTLGSISPRKAYLAGSPHTTDDDDELDLLYDQQLNCYYDPKTCKYYELS